MKYEKRRLIVLALAFLLIIIPSFFIYRAVFGSAGADLKMISGTEYISGEFGQVIIRLSDHKGNAITTALCNVTILYPDKSYFILDQPLQASSEPGNYYRQFTTPTINGIYEETIKCTSIVNGNPVATSVSSSFHVSVALNFIVEMSRLQAERYYDLVQRLNATQANINLTREEILREINETFSYGIVQRIEQSEGNITQRINESKQELNKSVSGMFGSMNSRMASLGTSILSIFGSG